MPAAEQPRVCTTLIVGADSVGVACECQTFIVEKTLADKILHVTPTESVGLYMICYKLAAPTGLIPPESLTIGSGMGGWSAVPSR